MAGLDPAIQSLPGHLWMAGSRAGHEEHKALLRGQPPALMHLDGGAERPLEALAGRLRRLENVAEAEELVDAESVDLGLDIDVGRVHGPSQCRDLLLLDLQSARQELEAGRPPRPRHGAADHVDAD